MADLIDSLKAMQQQAEAKFNKQSGLGLSTTAVPNPGISIVFFLIITTVLLILKIVLLPSKNLEDFKKESSVMKIIFIIYILLLLFGNYLINTSVTTELCGGTPQWGTTFIVTFLPWILIFGIINIVLIIFPGWLVPFSNTFGYFVVTLLGLKDLFNKKIIEPKSKSGNVNKASITEGNINVARALQQIYGNESLLLNEIPRVGNSEDERVYNFEDFYATMQRLGIFKSEEESENSQETKVNLYKLLKIKDYIAEYVWYILSGILVSSITYNYIVNIGCDFSSANMKAAYDKYITEDLSQNNVTDMVKVDQNMEESENIFIKK